MKIKKMLIIPTLLGVLLAGCDDSSPSTFYNSTPDFVVKVQGNENRLKLFQHIDKEENEETTLLSINKVESITSAYSYKWFLNESKGFTFENIHNEKTNSDIGKSTLGDGLSFFKYTFYVKNTCDRQVTFWMHIDLNENIQSVDDEAGMDEYLRLMVFEGDKSPVTYARRSKSRYDATGETYKEYISGREGTTNYFGEAELFESDSCLTTITNELYADSYRMYTLLFWLEGEDNECKSIPEKTYLKVTTTLEVIGIAV